MRNRLKYIFSFSTQGNYIIVYNKKKRIDNIKFPINFLKFNTSLKNIICEV